MDAQTLMQLKVMTLELAARTLKDAHPEDITKAGEIFFKYLTAQNGETNE